MTDTTLAKILAKGCQSTGLDEVVAREFHARLGMSKMAIVELTAASRTEDEDGQESVSLRIASIEVARTEYAEDTLRQIQRVLWRNRAEADGQAVIEESLRGEQTEGDVLRDARAQLGVDTETQNA